MMEFLNEYWLVGLTILSLVACLGTGGLCMILLGASVYKPEHAYTGLIRIRRWFMGFRLPTAEMPDV